MNFATAELDTPSLTDRTDRALDVRGVSKIYQGESAPIHALDNVSFSAARGEFLSITGSSGSGKSTLLHLIAGMDLPDKGEVEVEGVRLDLAGDHELTVYRQRHLGMVFQAFNLMPAMSVLENVALPLLLQGRPLKEATDRAHVQIQAVGLSRRTDHRTHQLSGGEMQRVAIARALVHGPSLVVADEPTGNLDSPNANLILDLLENLVRRSGITLVLVTHSAQAAQRADRTLHICDGKLVD
jgi:ABC-type lipoprotein export system ATPase subunit